VSSRATRSLPTVVEALWPVQVCSNRVSPTPSPGPSAPGPEPQADLRWPRFPRSAVRSCCPAPAHRCRSTRLQTSGRSCDNPAGLLLDSGSSRFHFDEYSGALGVDQTRHFRYLDPPTREACLPRRLFCRNRQCGD
jgi:hypothetical protein